MFFEQESLSFELLDILSLEQENVRVFNRGRPFSALSFRFRADTQLETDTEAYHVQDHCVAYFPANLPYTRTARVDEMIVFHFHALQAPTRKIEFFQPQDPRQLADLFRRALNLWNNGEPGYRHHCSAVLYEILALCHRENYRPHQSISRLQPSMEYLHRHYQDPELTIEELAAQSFMSQVYFRKLFKTEYGISPQKYVIRLRIRRAAELLSAGYYTLQEAARLSGYSDYKYFSVEFKKLMGVSPSEYVHKPHGWTLDWVSAP